MPDPVGQFDRSDICLCGVLHAGRRDPARGCPVHAHEDEAHWLKVDLASMRNLPETTEADDAC